MTRVTSVTSSYPLMVKYTSYFGDVSVYINTTMSVASKTVSRDDIRINLRDTSGWRKPSRYSASVTTNDRVRVIAKNDYYGDRVVWEADVPFSYPPIDATLPDVGDRNIAVIKARNNVADRVSSFGESLVELSQSISGLAKLAGQVDGFIESVQKRDYRGIARSLGISAKSRKHRRAVVRFRGLPATLGNAFLTWNFGLKPIINDMVALAIVMGSGKPLRVTGVGLYARQAGDPKVVSMGQQFFPYMPGSGAEVFCQNQVWTGTKAHLDYEISIPALRQLTSYGLLDAPATLWAVAPSSFLVDFVLPVSEVLRSLTATFGLTFKGGTATRFARGKSKYLYTKNHPWQVSRVLEFKAYGNDREVMSMERVVYTTDPNPVTLWLKDPCNSFVAATVMSLLAQKLKLVS